MQTSAAPVTQNGTRSTCNSIPPTSAAVVHASGARMRRIVCKLTMRGSLAPVRRQCREAAMSMFGPAVRLEVLRRDDEAVPLAARLGVHEPTRELLETRFDAEIIELAEIEDAQLGAHRAVFLDEQGCAARVRFPGHLARRVAVAERAQREPFVGAREAVRARA